MSRRHHKATHLESSVDAAEAWDIDARMAEAEELRYALRMHAADELEDSEEEEPEDDDDDLDDEDEDEEDGDDQDDDE